VLWACTTFATTLLYLLSEESPWPFFNALSPLAPDDNIRLYNDVKTSTMRILLCSLAVFFNHAMLTGATLWLNDAHIIALPSFLCGLFAVMPLLGTYVVVLPAAAILWAQDAVLSAVALGAAEALLVLVIDARITAMIPGNSHFVALSLVAGLYSFGPFGFLYGPLLVGLAGSLVRIYMRYLKKPLNTDMYSPQPPAIAKKLFQQTPTL
jgi:predicted PurR-regulated permease PerM